MNRHGEPRWLSRDYGRRDHREAGLPKHVRRAKRVLRRRDEQDAPYAARARDLRYRLALRGGARRNRLHDEDLGLRAELFGNPAHHDRLGNERIDGVAAREDHDRPVPAMTQAKAGPEAPG